MWIEKTFAELGYTYTGLSGKNKAAFGHGEPYIPYMNVFSNESINPFALDYVQISKGEQQNTVAVGDVLFTTSSETPLEVGMSSVLTVDVGTVYLNSFCFGFRLYKKNNFDQKFLSYAFRSKCIRKQMLIAAQGSTRHNLSKKNFNHMKLWYPIDTKEQARIAIVLAAVDEAIASSRALVEKYSAVKKGLFADLLGQGEKVTLKKLGGRFIRGQGITRNDIQEDGVPCIRYGELYTTYDICVYKPISHVSEELAIKCLHLKHGDLLFTLSGETAEEIGKTVVYLGKDEVVVGGDLAVYTGHKQNPLYLSYMLNAPDALKQKELRATGSMVVHINSTKLEEVSISLPKLSEQERIVEILTSCDDRLTIEWERLRKFENIKSGLMEDLLTNMVSTEKLQGGTKYD